MAIILWEVVVRTVTKEYTQPYAEYPQIIFPFQIVIQTAKNNLRPTIPETAPASVAALIEASWAKEPEKRPTAQEMLDRVRALMKVYVCCCCDGGDIESFFFFTRNMKQIRMLGIAAHRPPRRSLQRQRPPERPR